MDLGVIITAAVGVFTSFSSAWISWFFTRRKYSAEVEQSVIKNMNDSLEFYKALSDDNKTRLDAMIKSNEALEEEVRDLRKQVVTLMSCMCMDLTCQLRKKEVDIDKLMNAMKEVT